MTQPYARLYLIALMLAGLAVRLYFIFDISYFREDALITLRYGDNFWRGVGLVYNPGERVLGATSPLWTFLTGLIDFLFPIDIAMIVVNLVSLLFFVGITLLVWRLLAEYALPVRVVSITFLQLHPLVIAISMSGMETMLFIFLLLASMYAACQKRMTIGFALAALTALTRPEGAVWSVILALYVLYQTRAIPWRGLLVYGLIAAPWLLVATLYYGSPIPQSAVAKAGEDATLIDILWRPFDLLLLWFNFSGLRAILELPTAIKFVITVGWFACGVLEIRYVRRSGVAWLASGFFLLYLAFYYFGRPSVFDWYHVPGIVAYVLLASIPLGRWFDHLPIPAAVPLVALGVAMFLLMLTHLDHERFVQRYEDQVRRPAGDYLATCTPAEASIMMEPIGYIGYFSERRVIDMAGLITPAFARSYQDSAWIVETLQAFHPDYILLRRFELPENQFFAQQHQPFFINRADRRWFEETYIREKVFTWQEEPRLGFEIYRRKDLAALCGDEKEMTHRQLTVAKNHYVEPALSQKVVPPFDQAS